MTETTRKIRKRILGLLAINGSMDSRTIQDILKEAGMMPSNFQRQMRAIGAKARRVDGSDRYSVFEWYLPDGPDVCPTCGQRLNK